MDIRIKKFKDIKFTGNIKNNFLLLFLNIYLILNIVYTFIESNSTFPDFQVYPTIDTARSSSPADHRSDGLRVGTQGNHVSHFDDIVNLSLSASSIGHFSCPMCNRYFNKEWNLKQHLRIHTGERPYSCHLCPYKSTQNSTLKRHMLTQHTAPNLS